MPTLTLPGVLSTYPAPTNPALPIFLSGALTAPRAVLFIAGLGNTLLSVPYLPALSAAFERAGWTLAQAMTSSSAGGFASGSLDRDVREIEGAVKWLREEQGKEKVVLMGHSTGCQDLIHYLLHTPSLALVDGAIFQAPVSDREFFNSLPSYDPSYLELAQRFVSEGKGEEALPRAAFDEFGGVPITASRYFSLVGEGGADDYFSSTLPQSTLSQTFGRLPSLHTPIALIYSGADEYVPEYVDKAALVRRWADTAGEEIVKAAVVVQGAKHDYSGGGEPEKELVGVVERFLKGVHGGQ